MTQINNGPPHVDMSSSVRVPARMCLGCGSTETIEAIMAGAMLGVTPEQTADHARTFGIAGTAAITKRKDIFG